MSWESPKSIEFNLHNGIVRYAAQYSLGKQKIQASNTKIKEKNKKHNFKISKIDSIHLSILFSFHEENIEFA